MDRSACPGVPGQRLRVLHLGSPTGLYGAERWILAIVRNLPRAEIEPVVGVVRDEVGQTAPVCRRAAELGVETRVFDGYGRVSLQAVKAIRRFIIETGVGIIHSHGYKTDLIGLLAAAGTPCRTVTTPHGWNDSGAKLRMYEALDRAAFPLFDAVVPLSDGLYQGLGWIRPLGGRLHLIPNGLDLQEVADAGRESVPADAADGVHPFVVGYVGRLGPLKGIDTLLRAFAQFRCPGKQLWIVGEGPERAQLELLARQLGMTSQVRFFGYREDRLAILHCVNVLVLPSRSEGTPRCLLEAMAAGVPVVASDIEGCRILVRNGDTGLLFEMDDVADLVRQLHRLIADAGLRKGIVQRGREFVERRFSARAVASRYAALYRDVVGKPGSRTVVTQ